MRYYTLWLVAPCQTFCVVCGKIFTGQEVIHFLGKNGVVGKTIIAHDGWCGEVLKATYESAELHDDYRPF